MKTKTICSLFFNIVIIIFISALSNSNALAKRPDPERLMYAVRDLDDGHDRRSKMVVVLVDKRGNKRSRILKFSGIDVKPEQKDNPEEMRILKFIHPPNLIDMAFLIHSYDENLNREDDMWSYIPALRQVRRIATTEKDGSFIGSDFSFADVERLHVNEFTYKYLPDAVIEDKMCYVVEASPRDQRIKDKTGYSKKIMFIWNEHPIIIRNDFYDTNQKLFKRFKALKISQIQEKWTTLQMEMAQLDGSHKTFFIFSDYRYNTGLQSSEFSSKIFGTQRTK